LDVCMDLSFLEAVMVIFAIVRLVLKTSRVVLPVVTWSGFFLPDVSRVVSHHYQEEQEV